MPNGNSPMDPIFLMHHGNIDRIWWRWNCRGRVNTTDPLWREHAVHQQLLQSERQLGDLQAGRPEQHQHSGL